MSKGNEVIYRSDWPEPLLVEMGLFEYLFPSKNNQSPSPKYDRRTPAYIDGLDGRTITRGQIQDEALRLATGLKEIGIKKGDTACLWGLNSLEWVRAAFGCMAAGVTISPANAAYAPAEVAHQINDSGADVLFIQPELLPVFEKARPHLKTPFPDTRIVLLTKDAARPIPSRYKIVTDLAKGRVRAAPATFNGKEAHATAWLCYSSGTTGLPKGVMTSHYNMTSQLQAVNSAFTIIAPKKDVILGILPFSHIFGLTVLLLQSFTYACPLVVLPRFEEISVLKAIEKYKVTFGCVVPPVILVLLHSANLDKFDISSLKSLMSGAAPLSAELIQAFMKRCPHINLTQGYGLTETSPVVHFGFGERVGWCGRLIPTWEARLITDEGEDAAAGDRGELWVRGPSVMKGYHNNPAATEKTMAPGGWFKTGDVLVRDNADGWYKVVDRVKELIKYKGFQVPPAELEALLLQHPGVVDAGVIGVYDASQATELPRAYIVAKHAADIATPDAKNTFEQAVAAWVAERVAPHKKLRGGIEAIPAIPKSPSGKILRKDLRVVAQAERDAADKARAKL